MQQPPASTSAVTHTFNMERAANEGSIEAARADTLSNTLAWTVRHMFKTHGPYIKNLQQTPQHLSLIC